MGELSDFQKLEFSLWIAVFVLLIILTYYFLRRGFNKEDIPKTFNKAAGIIFFGLAMMRLFSILYDFSDLFHQNSIILFLGNAFLFLGALPLVMYMEKNVIKKTKYILTLIALILFGIYIYIGISSEYDRIILYYWSVPPFGVELFILAIGYFYLIIKSSGLVRKSTILIVIGVALLITFWVLHGVYGPNGQEPIPIVQDYLAIISPVAVICGSLIAAKGFFGYT
jgi:hypothetical protein